MVVKRYELPGTFVVSVALPFVVQGPLTWSAWSSLNVADEPEVTAKSKSTWPLLTTGLLRTMTGDSPPAVATTDFTGPQASGNSV